MVSCSFCGRKAVYVSKALGRAYCKKHFLEYFDKKVRRTIRKHRMFSEKETIIVAVSGGKDSLALLHYLVRLSKRVPGWTIKALLVDEGIRGYREITIKDFLRVVDELGVEYRIVRFKDELGYTLDEIIEIGRRKKLPYHPCSYCGVFRRYLLNKAAREMGGTVIATAHNLDDVIQTYLMNIIKNSWEKIVRLGPVSGITGHPRFVRKVKPFYEILEKESALYAVLNNLYPKFVECPYAQQSMRWYLRKYINNLEEMYPGTKYSMLRSLLRIIQLLEDKTNKIIEGEIRSCRICGEPASHDLCRACTYRLELGIMDEKGNIIRNIDTGASGNQLPR